jgi:uroporphyrinogen decarboxylase
VEFTLNVTEKARKEVRFDYFNFFEDFAGKGGPLVSPELFRKFFLPGYRRIIGEFRRNGIEHFWLDSDGDTRVLIPLMIEAGITCHWPLEQASDMEPVMLRREYGHDMAFCGGIDKRALTKGKEDIERELYAKIPPLQESGGYIPHVDHTFPPDISYENFLYYMELKEKLLW